MIHLSALSSALLVERRWAAAVAQDQATQAALCSAIRVVETNWFLHRERGVADHRLLFVSALFSSLKCVITEYGTLAGSKTMMRSFNIISLLRHGPVKTERAITPNRNQIPDIRDQALAMCRYFFNDYGMAEALKQDRERCAASRTRRILDAQMGHTVPCLQVCRQLLATTMMHML